MAKKQYLRILARLTSNIIIVRSRKTKQMWNEMLNMSLLDRFSFMVSQSPLQADLLATVHSLFSLKALKTFISVDKELLNDVPLSFIGPDTACSHSEKAVHKSKSSGSTQMYISLTLIAKIAAMIEAPSAPSLKKTFRIVCHQWCRTGFSCMKGPEQG